MYFNNRGQAEMKQYAFAIKEIIALRTSAISKALFKHPKPYKRHHDPEFHWGNGNRRLLEILKSYRKCLQIN